MSYSVIELIPRVQNIFKKVTHEKLNVGCLPIYNIKGGDEAISYNPNKDEWQLAPTVNVIVGRDDPISLDYCKYNRRCYTNGSMFVTNLKAFDKIFASLKDCENRELLMITWGSVYDYFAMIVKDIYEDNPKFF